MKYFFKQVSICVVLICCFFSCLKEDDNNILSFQEKLIGDWEWRSVLDFSQFHDLEYHEPEPPFWILTFRADSSYLLDRNELFEDEIGTYEVNDSIVIFSPAKEQKYGWRMLVCRNDTMDVFVGQGREGPLQYRYLKIK